MAHILVAKGERGENQTDTKITPETINIHQKPPVALETTRASDQGCTLESSPHREISRQCVEAFWVVCPTSHSRVQWANNGPGSKPMGQTHVKLQMGSARLADSLESEGLPPSCQKNMVDVRSTNLLGLFERTNGSTTVSFRESDNSCLGVSCFRGPPHPFGFPVEPPKTEEPTPKGDSPTSLLISLGETQKCLQSQLAELKSWRSLMPSKLPHRNQRHPELLVLQIGKSVRAGIKSGSTTTTVKVYIQTTYSRTKM